MRKLYAVFKREYLQAVRKKMFIIMTFLTPVLMTLVMTLPAMLIRRGVSDKRVAVIDGTGRLRDAFSDAVPAPDMDPRLAAAAGNTGGMQFVYIPASESNAAELTKQHLLDLRNQSKTNAFDAIVSIPPALLTQRDLPVTLYSRSAADVVVQERVERRVERAVQRLRFAEAGIPPNEVENYLKGIAIDAVQVTRSGVEKRGGEANLMIGFVFVALLIVPVFIYGVEVMRGIIQEKNDRVVEVLISSVTPTQLLAGKILGVAAVGLTQLAVWVTVASLFAAQQLFVARMAGINVLQFLRPSLFAYFIVFFVLAYLLFVCIYAIGGAACSTEKDAQQMVAPILVVLMLPWFLMIPILTNPDSTLAVALSLVPLFAPITMFVRILVSDPPLWHIALSIALTVGTIWLLLTITGKIFRVGILSTGKRVTIPEIWRWLRVA